MAETSNLLSQEELDALAAGIEDGSIESDTGINTGARAVKHDLTNEDSSLGVNVGAIDMINERFVRQFRLGLLEVLRTTPKVNMANVEIMKFGDYLKDLSPPLAVNTIRLNPLRGYSMVVIDPSVIFASLDNFFGGFGRGIDGLPPGRMFTPTETRIINIMLEVVFSSLTEAWAPIMDLTCESVGSEINPQFVQIVDENDLVIVCHLDVELSGKERGAIDVVYPFATLKPIRDVLRGRVQDSDDPSVDHRIWERELIDATSDAELQHRVILGEIDLMLGQFDNLKAGDILDLRKYDLARVLVGDIPLFEAEIGNANGYAAARLVRSVELSESDDT